MPKQVTKVKRLKERVTVEWLEPNGAHFEDGALRDCPDDPSKDFLDALATVEADLVARARGRVTFKASKPGEGKASQFFELTGISVTRNSAGRRQFTASAKIDFGWGWTGQSLPFLLEPDDEKPSTADNVLAVAELANIEQLLECGRLYAEGERLQSTLALEGEDDEGEGERAAA